MLRHLNKLYINPCINFILMIIYSQMAIDINWAFSVQFAIGYSVFCILINSLTFFCVLRKTNKSWESLLASFFLYIVLTLLVIFIMMIFGSGDNGGEIENNAEGIVLIIIYFLSIPNLLIGNILAMILYRTRQGISGGRGC